MDTCKPVQEQTVLEGLLNDQKANINEAQKQHKKLKECCIKLGWKTTPSVEDKKEQLPEIFAFIDEYRHQNIEMKNILKEISSFNDWLKETI